MKKTIKNRTYNTKTARKIAVIQMTFTGILAKQNDNGNMAESIIETLFRKRTGEFFLLREDRFGSNLIPLEYAEAKRWGEENNLPDETLRDAFWLKANDVGKTVLCVTISRNIAQRLKSEAAANKKTISGFLEELLRIKFE